jgi:hypothetical protein
VTDLFGDIVTAPQCAASALRLSTRNAAEGFAEFWKAWPRSPRRVAKQQCLDKWARYGCAEQGGKIIAHVEWMKTQDDWLRDSGRFICAPLVYLNQQRWLDWEPPAPAAPRPDALAKILADEKNAAKPSASVRQWIAKVLGRE